MVRSRSITPLFVFVLAVNSTTFAQWSHNPALNLGISVRGSDQNQVKILPMADGGCYMTWLDGIGTGWDTRLQRLDNRGLKQLGPNGVMVGDTAFSSTQDYGFAIDANGNAVIAYRDDSNNGSPVQIKIQKVDPSGNLLWGPTGVQVSSVAGGNAPHCCVTSDGGAAVGWGASAGGVRVQKVDASGTVLWVADGVVDTLVTGLPLLTDVQAGDNGSVIAVYFKSAVARQVFTRKFDTNGNKVWFTPIAPNVGPFPLFDESGNGVQAGSTIYFLPDGAGGAYFSWYGTGGTRSSYVQHLNAAGIELFPHNGVKIATDIANRMRTSNDISIDSTNGDIYMVSAESQVSPAGNYSIRAQRFDSAGNQLWNAGAGVELFPQGTLQPTSITVQAIPGGGALFSWINGSFNSQEVYATRLDSSGAFVWTPNILEISTTVAGKARLWSSKNAAGSHLILAWADNKNAATNDIYAQRVNFDGSLGNPGDVNDDGVVNIDDLVGVITTWGACAPFCPSDLTPPPAGDGQIDIDDLVKVITNWG